MHMYMCTCVGLLCYFLADGHLELGTAGSTLVQEMDLGTELIPYRTPISLVYLLLILRVSPSTNMMTRGHC